MKQKKISSRKSEEKKNNNKRKILKKKQVALKLQRVLEFKEKKDDRNVRKM